MKKQDLGLTRWFPVTIKPVHQGRYQFRGYLIDGPEPFYAVWTGVQWGNWINGYWLQLAKDRNDEWRGLAVKP